MPNIYLKLHIHIHLNLFKATRRAACNVRGSPSALPGADPQPGAEAPADVRGHPRGLRGPASGTTAILGTRGEGGWLSFGPSSVPRRRAPPPPSAVPKAVPEARRASATAGTPRTQEPGVAQARRLQAALRGRGAPPGGKGKESGRCAVLRYKMRRGLLRRAKGFGVFFWFGSPPHPRLPSPLCCSLLLPLSGDLRGKIANPQPSPKKPNPRQEKRPRWRRRAGGSARCSPSAGRGDGR